MASLRTEDARASLVGSDGEQPQVRYVAAAVAQLTLHILSFISNTLTLVVYILFGEWRFFGALFAAWASAAVLISWAALKELRPRAKPRWLLRWLWVVIALGLCRGLQVVHICRFFKQRRARTGEPAPQPPEPTAFNSKTFDGIVEGLFFAVGNQFAFFMLDLDAPSCSWYMAKDFAAECPSCPGTSIRIILLFSATLSMLNLAAGMVEVDYRVSMEVRKIINASSLGASVHFAYRASEVVFHLSLINLLCIFMRPPLDNLGRSAPYLLYLPFFAVFLVNVCILYRSNQSASNQEFPLAYAAVAVTSIAAIPTVFVDRPLYERTARNTASAFFNVRLAEYLLVAVCIAWFWNTEFPCDLEGYDGPRKLGQYTLWPLSNHRLAYVELLAASAVHGAIVVCQPYVRRVNTRISDARRECQQRLRRQEYSCFMMTDREGSGLQADVRRTVPKDVSSLLVQAGTGVSNGLFADRAGFAMTDFDIECVLGRGAFGVVVKVIPRWHGDEPLHEDVQKPYAVKLQNIQGAWQAIYYERECEYLQKLNAVRHPFIMRLVRFFDVSPDLPFQDIRGREVTTLFGVVSFHKALMMDYCPMGDLQAYLQRNALTAPAFNEQPPAGAEGLEGSLQWLDTARRLCAQLLEAVRFLHGQNFAHRDLKPANVLLKSGCNGLHVCVADFGYAKQPQPGQPLWSVAGDTEYMAPEIRETYDFGQWRGEQYTESVDLYSLGKIFMVMLWGTKYFQRVQGHVDGGVWMLQIPSRQLWDQWCGGEDGHPRVPQSAKVLVDRMMQGKDDAHRRGTAAALARQPFFQAVEHRGMQLARLDFSGCQRQSGWY